MSDRFRLRPAFNPALELVGNDREPLVRVDRVMEDPGSLVDFAAEEVAFKPAWTADGGYPGIGAPAPLDYVGSLVRALDPVIRDAFGLCGVKLGRADCNLSMVTLEPHELAPLQRIPHIDTTYALQFAILHYLCRPDQGGTAFYRHRATGFEAITEERWPEYERSRDGELAALDEARKYMTGDTPSYERIGCVEAAFDRLIIYRSRLLHSGQIPADQPLSSNPRNGRLTANIFLSYRAQ